MSEAADVSEHVDSRTQVWVGRNEATLCDDQGSISPVDSAEQMVQQAGAFRAPRTNSRFRQDEHKLHMEADGNGGRLVGKIPTSGVVTVAQRSSSPALYTPLTARRTLSPKTALSPGRPPVFSTSSTSVPRVVGEGVMNSSPATSQMDLPEDLRIKQLPGTRAKLPHAPSSMQVESMVAPFAAAQSAREGTSSGSQPAAVRKVTPVESSLPSAAVAHAPPSSTIRSLSKSDRKMSWKCNGGQEEESTQQNICVHYSRGEKPSADMLLAGGSGSRVTVGYVAPGSKAQRAGVQEGCALLAINNSRHFNHLPGWHVRMLLRAPCTLFFELVGPPPKGPSEIRVRRLREETVGIPLRVGVCGPTDEGVLAEEVVFKPTAGIWISADKGGAEVSRQLVNEAIPSTNNNNHRAAPLKFGKADDLATLSQVYQLQRKDANDMIGKALVLAGTSEASGGLPDPTTQLDEPLRAYDELLQDLPRSERRVLEGVQICDEAVFMESKCRQHSSPPMTCFPDPAPQQLKIQPTDAAGPVGAMRSIRRGRQNSPPMHKASGDLHPVVRLESADKDLDAKLNTQSDDNSRDAFLGPRTTAVGVRSLPAYSLSPSPITRLQWTPSATGDLLFRSHSKMSLQGPRRSSPPARAACGDTICLSSMDPEVDVEDMEEDSVAPCEHVIINATQRLDGRTSNRAELQEQIVAIKV